LDCGDGLEIVSPNRPTFSPGIDLRWPCQCGVHHSQLDWSNNLRIRIGLFVLSNANGILPFSFLDVDREFNVLSTISTGQGMVAPWIRMIAGLEAMIGFGIVTASISWLLSIYPIVEARRSLAHQATLLHASEKMSGLDLLRDGVDDAPAILMSIAHDLSVLRNQMAQFPISYYFYVGERRTTLAGILPYLAELADRSLKNDVPVQLRIPGIMLRGAVEDFSIMLAKTFLHMGPDTESEVLQAYAYDQMCEAVSSVGNSLRDRRSA
jgi:hypothetical protein